MRRTRVFAVVAAALFALAISGAHGLLSPAAASDQTTAAQGQNNGDNFDFFSDKPVQSDQVVALPPEKSKWITVGGPIALIAFFFLLDLTIWWLVPYSDHSIELNLRNLPPAVKRGIAMAV